MRGTDFPEAKVGIFWCYKGERFVVFTQSLRDANRTEISFDSTFAHWHEWQILQKESRLKSLPRELRSEYDSILRSRVVYKIKKNHSSILHGSSFTERIKNQVIVAFHLPMEKVEDLPLSR
jgi:hypothetical protein